MTFSCFLRSNHIISVGETSSWKLLICYILVISFSRFLRSNHIISVGETSSWKLLICYILVSSFSRFFKVKSYHFRWGDIFLEVVDLLHFGE